MTDSYETVVIGGGIVGASVAYHLAEGGTRTLLVDRDDEGRATDAGAGIISAATSSRSDDDDWFAFAADATAYYPTLVEELKRVGVEETSYDRLGGLSVVISDDELEPHRAALESIDRRGDRVEDAVELDPSEAVAMFPPLAKPREAFYHPGVARIDGRQFTRALLTAAREHGLAEREADVTDVRVRDGAVVGVTTADGTRIDASRVVVAGGAWTPAFGDPLGIEIPVEPKRGQLVHLDLPETDTADWPIVSGYRHHYVVPWPDGRIVVGATRDSGSGFTPHPTASGIREVLDEALRVAPGLGDARLREIRVGLRPVTPDGLPVLGSVPGVEGTFLATGHGPTGLMLGPYSGKIVADLLLDGADRIPKPLEPGRFE